MKVLTIYAHHDPNSFCHAVLERFTDGLRDAGHTSEVLDLYADGFDPVFRDRDAASYTSATIPGDVLDLMDLRGRVLRSCRWPGQRWLATRALRGKSQAEIAALIRTRMPKDVLAYQAQVSAADALAFIAPIHFCAFPAILKGWIDRVWTLDFAFALTSAGWHGDVNGRIPLLKHKRVLGLELGGVPLATLLSHVTGLPTLFVRKEAKTYGTCRLAEGGDPGGRTVLLVEDIISTGGALRNATQTLRALGATVTTVVCAIDRPKTEVHPLAADGLTVRSVLTQSQLDSLSTQP